MAQENLLQQLYTYATHLNPLELEAMLNEDPELMQKRAAAQMAVKVRDCSPSVALDVEATAISSNVLHARLKPNPEACLGGVTT